MEVHAQVTSQSKLFSGASTGFGGEPNSHVSLVDAALPGMLPVVNEQCIKQAVRTGLGLNARINLKSVFDRKNYFYPDLPQGYQISQYKSPLVGEGEVIVELPDGDSVTVGIERLHLEQDAGKLLHDRHPTMSLCRPQPLGYRADGDRLEAGHALGRRGESLRRQAAHDPALSRHLRRRHGERQPPRRRECLRAPPGAPLGTRCEIKNVNSIRFIGQAIEYEARRQIAILEDGGTIEQETRLFDPDEGETRSMRNKEEAHDYRYFPDPICCRWSSTAGLCGCAAERICRNCRTRRRRGSWASMDCPTMTRECSWRSATLAEFFEAVAKGRDAKVAANWIINELPAGSIRKERTSRTPRLGSAARHDPRPDRSGYDLRQARQGTIRDHVG